MEDYTQEEKENWKKVYGFEYEISSLGRCRSLDRKREYLNRPLKGRILKPQNDGKGYLVYWLWRDRKYKKISAHQLVARAFIPNPENKPEVNHKKGIKTDNRVSELEWVTPKENVQHAFKNGFLKNQFVNKLNSDDVLAIRTVLIGHNQRYVAGLFGVSQGTISNVLNNKYGYL